MSSPDNDRWRRPRKIKGLGDIVEILASPIAEGIDKVFNTEIGSCSSCQKRKDFLNKLVPFDSQE